MVDSRRIVRVFLASPGDLQAERCLTKAIVDRCNKLWAQHFGYQVELMGWEDTVSGAGRPQELINKELDRCEVFIGLMWKKWGTPPDETGRFTSGFEEEFERSMERRERSGNPEISLYLKEIPPDLLSDLGPELKKVLDFRQKIIEGKKILYEQFKDGDDFAEKIERCIAAHVPRDRALASAKRELQKGN